MKKEEMIGFTLATLLLVVAMSLPVFSPEYSGPMNASIQQVISISLSENLTKGIFFTNDTMNDTQVNISVMEGRNNAIYNYPGGDQSKTEYWIQSTSGTTNVTICHCACAPLTCSGGGLCTIGTDTLAVACSNPGSPDDCVGFYNTSNDNTGGSMSSGYTSPNFGFPAIDQYQIIGPIVDNNKYVNLRYWLNPNPDNAPSGIYNTTWMIRAVESDGTSPGNCGTCSC